MDSDVGRPSVGSSGGMTVMGSPPGRTVHRQLVGRDAELDRLEAFLRRAAAHGESLLLTGPAGVGKTALLNATVDIAATSGWLVLAGGGADLESDLPFGVLHQLLLPVATPAPGPDRNAVTIAVGAGRGDAPHTRRVAAEVLDLLRRLAESTPVLLIVDDLHLVDPSTRAVLGSIAESLADLRVGLLASTPDDTDAVIDAGVATGASGAAAHRRDGRPAARRAPARDGGRGTAASAGRGRGNSAGADGAAHRPHRWATRRSAPAAHRAAVDRRPASAVRRGGAGSARAGSAVAAAGRGRQLG